MQHARKNSNGGAGHAPLRSVIDFGDSAPPLGGGRIASQGSIESGMHHRAAVGGGAHHAAGAVQPGSVDGGASLNFYAGDAAYAGGQMGGHAAGAHGQHAGGYAPVPQQQPIGGTIRGGKPMLRTFSSAGGAFLGEGVEDEPPILEELGINLSHIAAKTKSVLRPTLKTVSPEFSQDTDLAGPLVFCLVLGTLLLFKGKVSFGYIYGCGTIGCAGMYAVLNLMSTQGIDVYRTVSVLGYCLLPIVFLAAVSVVVDLRGVLGYVLIPVGVLWCTNAAALFFVVQLGMHDQRWLVAYPVMLFYAVFALISVF
mmetsp:Transcript_16761/g.48581  ORF Transcript_16761/g.48581 Transcript_16761/m.48581 type:complete len:310 (-) Transcript_16761:636-1565(-)